MIPANVKTIYAIWDIHHDDYWLMSQDRKVLSKELDNLGNLVEPGRSLADLPAQYRPWSGF